MYQGNILDIKDTIDKYIETFGDEIPLIMVKDDITDEQLIDIIEDAIEDKTEIPITSFIYYKELLGEII